MKRGTRNAVIAASVLVLSVAAIWRGVLAPREAGRSPAPLRSSLLGMAEIIDIAKERMPGEILSIDTSSEEEIPVYKIKVLASDGAVHVVRLNGQTGKVIDDASD